MARQLFAVFVEDFDYLYQSDRYRSAYQTNDRTSEQMMVFFSEEAANEAAKDLAVRHPTKDVHVFKQTHGFIAPTRPVETKVWTEEGTYVPA